MAFPPPSVLFSDGALLILSEALRGFGRSSRNSMIDLEVYTVSRYVPRMIMSLHTGCQTHVHNVKRVERVVSGSCGLAAGACRCSVHKFTRLYIFQCALLLKL